MESRQQNLQTPETFLNEGCIDKDTKTLKEGCIIYHGAPEGKRIPSNKVPAFFSDKQTATVYTRKHPEYLTAFRVKTSPKLLELTIENLFRAVYTSFPEELKTEGSEVQELLQAYVAEDEEGTQFIRPTRYFTLGDKFAELPIYLNRRIIDLVCKMGYDGWIVFPGTLLQGLTDVPRLEAHLAQLTTAYKAKEAQAKTAKEKQQVQQAMMLHTAEVAFLGTDPLTGDEFYTRIEPVSPEIALCKWDKFLEPVENANSAGGRRRARKSKRATRRTKK